MRSVNNFTPSPLPPKKASIILSETIKSLMVCLFKFTSNILLFIPFMMSNEKSEKFLTQINREIYRDDFSYDALFFLSLK